MKYRITCVRFACRSEEVEAYRSCGFTPKVRPEYASVPGAAAYEIDGAPPAEIDVETVAELIAAAARVDAPIIVEPDGTLQIYDDWRE